MMIEIDGARLDRELRTMATFTMDDPGEASDGATDYSTAVTRIVFSQEDLRARNWLKALAAESGFTIREDAVGNTFIAWPGAEPGLPSVATGSHIDAIPHAGMYDGTVGVLGGLEAMRALRRSGFKPRRTLEMILLTSEEPTRFGIGCLGSRLISGVLDPAIADGLTDSGGKTLAEVRGVAQFRGSLSDVRFEADHYHGWVELHIEQGPLLEREQIPLGIVTSIAAPASYKFVIEGLGGHAGALLMPDRHDALCAAAEVILSVEHHARATGCVDTVATVGTCDVFPGAVNSVPSRVTLALDIRDTNPDRRETVMTAVRIDCDEVRARRHVRISETAINADTPCDCSPHIISTIEGVCRDEGIAFRKMVSRAYHDSLFMSRIAPVAMIFIPCKGGISHRPEEYASIEDIVRGTKVLAATLAKLASE